MTTELLIKSAVESLSTELDLDNGLYYFFGSPIAINSQMSKIMSANDKYPAVIMFNEFEETQGETLSHFGRTANITLYFMTLAGKNWSEEEHIDDAISPMDLIAEMLREGIEGDKRFGNIDDWTKTNRSNWGLILQQHNSKKSVFPDTLSGVEVNFTLKVKRNYC